MGIPTRKLIVFSLSMSIFIPACAHAQAIPYKGKIDRNLARSGNNFQNIRQALARGWERTMQSAFDYNADGDFNDKDVETLETVIAGSAYDQVMDLNGDGKLDAADASLMRNLVRFGALSRETKAITLQDLKVPCAAALILGLARSGKGNEAATLLQLLDAEVVAAILKDRQLNDQQVANLLGQFSAQKARQVLGYFSNEKTARIMARMETGKAGQPVAGLARDQVAGVLAQMINAQNATAQSRKNAGAILNALETSQAVEALKSLKSGEIADLMCCADTDKSAALLESLGNDAASTVIEAMSDRKRSQAILHTLNGVFVRQLASSVGASDMARILSGADPATIDAILSRLNEEIAGQIREELKKQAAVL